MVLHDALNFIRRTEGAHAARDILFGQLRLESAKHLGQGSSQEAIELTIGKVGDAEFREGSPEGRMQAAARIRQRSIEIEQISPYGTHAQTAGSSGGGR